MSSDVRKIIDPGAPYSRTLKYSIDEKLAIISHAKNHGNRAAGREFNVAESSIREWRKNENKLINNRNNAVAGLSSSSSHTAHSNIAAGSANLNNKNNLHNNNNNNFNKNGNLQQPHLRQNLLPAGSVFRIGNENNGDNQIRNQEHLMKIQLVQLAMMNMDFTHLAQLSPFLQLQHQRQLQAASSAHLSFPAHEPSIDSISTSSSVAGTPSSNSSSSTPPPSLSPVLSGSGRRKPKCPQKIVTSSGEEPAVISANNSIQV